MTPVQLQDRKEDARPTGIYTFKPGPYSSHTLLIGAFSEQGEGRRVLDVGCAEGHLARVLAVRGFEVVGIERPGPRPVDFPHDVQLIQADLDQGVPSLSGTFDFIMCADILEHLRDPQQFLLELHSRFTPGGRLIASLPNSGNLYFRLNVLLGRFPSHDRGLFDRTHLHFLTWDRWQELFALSGFQIEKVLPTGVPVGLAFPRWEKSWLMRAAERIAFELGRAWKGLFAYQFVVVARPEVPR